MARYVPGNVPTTTDIQQLERWLREELERVRQATDDIYRLAQSVLDNFTAAGYGGIGQNAATNPLPDFPAGGFIDFTGFDVPLVVPRAVGYDFGQAGLILEAPGVWYISIKLTFEHDELNAGREMYLRFDNRTTGIPNATIFRYGVGRNVGVTNLVLGAFFEVDDASVGEIVGLEVGGDTAFTGVSCIGAIMQVHNISEFKGELDIEANSRRI